MNIGLGKGRCNQHKRLYSKNALAGLADNVKDDEARHQSKLVELNILVVLGI